MRSFGKGEVSSMAKIGVVLAGAASKGAYEIGALRAIEDAFGIENIKCVSSASIGSIVAQAHGMGKSQDLENVWKNLDPKKYGRFILSYSGNKEILDMIVDTLSEEHKLPYELYVSVWNYTKKKVEYIPFHELDKEHLAQYLRGAIAIPILTAGHIVDGERILDGAFLDNIPVYPLIDKDLDYIFCIYFDNRKYFFENDDFNKKIVKIYDFPNEKMLELMVFNPKSMEGMIQYGYDYTMKTIKELFTSDDPEDVYKAIAERDENTEAAHKPRLTADIVLTGINDVTTRYSKRMSKRISMESKKKNK